MMDSDSKLPDQAATPGAAGARRPYEPPAIEETSEFETLALTCAQNQGICGPVDPYNDPPVEYSNS
jgi:hypothetical protein